MESARLMLLRPAHGDDGIRKFHPAGFALGGLWRQALQVSGKARASDIGEQIDGIGILCRAPFHRFDEPTYPARAVLLRQALHFSLNGIFQLTFEKKARVPIDITQHQAHRDGEHGKVSGSQPEGGGLEEFEISGHG